MEIVRDGLILREHRVVRMVRVPRMESTFVPESSTPLCRIRKDEGREVPYKTNQLALPQNNIQIHEA